MENIPAENIAATIKVLIGLQNILVFLAIILLGVAAKKFYLSSDKPPHPLRFRPIPPHFILAFCILLFTIGIRSLIIGSLAINTAYEFRIFTSMLLLFTALAGIRRVGESPIAGTLISMAGMLLALSALIFYPSAEGNGADQYQNLITLYRLLLVIGYSLLFSALAMILSKKWRPPIDEPVRSRGLITSSDLLTDHRHKTISFFRTAIPILLASLLIQCIYNILSTSVLFNFTIDTGFTLTLIWTAIIFLHFPGNNDKPGRLLLPGQVKSFLARSVCSMKGGAIAIALSSLPTIYFIIIPFIFNSKPNAYDGALYSAIILFISLVPCICQRTGTRFFTKDEYLSFDLLMNGESEVPTTTVQVNNPQLVRGDVDNALVMLGFREYTVSDLDPHNNSFRVASFGLALTWSNYFSHLLYVVLFMLLPICALKGLMFNWLFCLILGMCSLLMLITTIFPWFIVAYHIKPDRETCLITMRIYSGGLLASPSKLVKQLTSHLIVEHESML